MNKNFLLVIITCFLISSCEDYADLKKIQHLSETMSEVSGLAMIPDSDLIWMINDSGNKNIVYGYRAEGDIEREIEITNAKNVDWEDLASDEQGNLYIPDFGNNGLDSRDTFIVYKIPSPNTLKSDKVTAEIIEFSFLNKDEVKSDGMKFNAEALVYIDSFLYIFTKNRNDRDGGRTTVYRLPSIPGKYNAREIEELRTCSGRNDCYITAAALSPNKKRLALQSHDKVFILENFVAPNFSRGKLIEIDLVHSSQKEGVTFKNDSTLYITDERRIHTGGNLYEFRIKK